MCIRICHNLFYILAPLRFFVRYIRHDIFSACLNFWMVLRCAARDRSGRLAGSGIGTRQGNFLDNRFRIRYSTTAICRFAFRRGSVSRQAALAHSFHVRYCLPFHAMLISSIMGFDHVRYRIVFVCIAACTFDRRSDDRGNGQIIRMRDWRRGGRLPHAIVFFRQDIENIHWNAFFTLVVGSSLLSFRRSSHRYCFHSKSGFLVFITTRIDTIFSIVFATILAGRRSRVVTEQSIRKDGSH